MPEGAGECVDNNEAAEHFVVMFIISANIVTHVRLDVCCCSISNCNSGHQKHSIPEWVDVWVTVCIRACLCTFAICALFQLCSLWLDLGSRNVLCYASTWFMGNPPSNSALTAAVSDFE